MVRSTLPPSVVEELSPILVCSLTVEADSAGAPVAVKLSGQWIPVREVVDRWKIDDEWVPGHAERKVFWDCLMSKRMRITVHQDLGSGLWYW